MKQRWKLPVCLLLSFVLLLSATGMVFAAEGAAPAGVYELTTDRGGSRAPVWETARSSMYCSAPQAASEIASAPAAIARATLRVLI